MDNNYIVKKSNYFIMNSCYDLTLEEQKLILTLASMVQPTDEEFKPYLFKISDFIKLLGITDQSKYSEIPKITKGLMKKVFEIDEGKKVLQVAWLSSAEYESGSGQVELMFSPKLKPYMLKLSDMFTQYKLTNILSMKSKYSPRIYEILKCNEFKKQGKIVIELTELRKLLKAENIYPRYYDFKKNVLEATQKELDQLTDISFDFNENRERRKVKEIEFIISKNIKNVSNTVENNKGNNKDINKDNNSEKEIKELADLMKITSKEAKAIYTDGNKDLKYIVKIYNHFKDKNTKNIVGLMRKMVKPGAFIEPKQIQLGFNNFESRQHSERYLKLQELCLIGQASPEEREEFEKLRIS